MRQHHYSRTDVPMTAQGGAKKRIRIGNDCWIGSHCVVGEPVNNGSIVGAGSVVTRPIPDFSIAVGNPARVLKSRREAGN
jgi:acetyltransferase-like isoleucine patch superfamily enzyme